MNESDPKPRRRLRSENWFNDLSEPGEVSIHGILLAFTSVSARFTLTGEMSWGSAIAVLLGHKR